MDCEISLHGVCCEVILEEIDLTTVKWAMSWINPQALTLYPNPCCDWVFRISMDLKSVDSGFHINRKGWLTRNVSWVIRNFSILFLMPSQLDSFTTVTRISHWFLLFSWNCKWENEFFYKVYVCYCQSNSFASVWCWFESETCFNWLFTESG